MPRARVRVTELDNHVSCLTSVEVFRDVFAGTAPLRSGLCHFIVTCDNMWCSARYVKTLLNC